VVDRADRDRLAQLVRDAETALKADRPYWQAVWPHRFVLFATSDPNTFDQGWFDGSLGVDFGGYEFQQPSVTRGGKVNFQFGEPRVVVDLARATDNFALIHLLRHEFTHAATADVTKPNTATWVIEGYAEQVAWRGVQLADTAAYWDLLNPTVGPSMWRPPAGISGQDDRFYAGNVRRHYELAFLAFRFLQDNYGQQRTNAFYQAAQGEGPVPTDAYRLLGLTPESFLIHWRTWARDASGSGWGDLY
jgi:hypothetical protein